MGYWYDGCYYHSHSSSHSFKLEDNEKKRDHDCCKKEKDKNGLLTEFDFDEFNQNQNPSPEIDFLIPLANTDICIDDKCDRVLLNAAINWTPTGTFTQTLNLTNASPVLPEVDLVAFVDIFTIWRGNPFKSNGQAAPICTFVDSSPVSTTIQTIDIDPTTPGFQPGLSFTTEFSPVTTDFKCIDENPDCGRVEYFLTMLKDPGISVTASAVTFTAMEIEKHDDDCCDC